MNNNLIYISKIDPSLDDDIYNNLLQKISAKNQEKCLRFKFREDALRTLYGELLLRYVLCHKFGFKNEEIQILKSEEGKPYIKGYPIHFNISHSGDYVACAFSEQEVGVDIEQIKKVDMTMAKRFFSKNEWTDLFAKNEEEHIDHFFSLWTLKESYIKWLGKGMSVPLDLFSFKITKEGITIIDANRSVRPYFKQFIIDDYKVAVCSNVDGFSYEIVPLTSYLPLAIIDLTIHSTFLN
jgi:4'-phosphopantetheinyl transferase